MLEKKKIGFIGLGVMGASMAEHLLNAGYELHVHNRTKSKADALIAKGAIWEDSPADLAKEVEVVISMVGYPQDVEEIYLGEKGVFKTMKQGYIVDMTTSSPKLAKKLHEEAKNRGIAALDAPVSGGDIGAKNATLVIMVGGDRSTLNELRPILQVIGRNIYYFGNAGSGQFAKMANQIAVAGNMLGAAESMAFVKKAGLEPAEALETITGGAGSSWALANLAPRMLRDDRAPGFFVKHFIKDMSIALEAAEEMKLDLPGLQLAKRLYDELADKGLGDCGTQTLFAKYMGEI